MSVESETRKALRRVIFWRIVTETVELPRDIFRALALVVDAFTDWIDGVSYAFFYAELDAARRYRTLTGVDLGVGSGSERHVGLTPEALERVEQALAEED